MTTRKGYAHIEQEPMVFPDFGKGNCLRCGEPLPYGRRKYCCDSCGWYYRRMTVRYILISWQDFKNRMIKRDNKACQDCGDKAEEVHNITPIYKGGEEFDKDNCISLCHRCHMNRHAEIRLNDKPPDKYPQSHLDNY